MHIRIVEQLYGEIENLRIITSTKRIKFLEEHEMTQVIGYDIFENDCAKVVENGFYEIKPGRLHCCNLSRHRICRSHPCIYYHRTACRHKQAHTALWGIAIIKYHYKHAGDTKVLKMHAKDIICLPHRWDSIHFRPSRRDNDRFLLRSCLRCKHPGHHRDSALHDSFLEHSVPHRC